MHKPLGLLAELTHRCPLGCPYCSNPLALETRDDELDTATWARVFREAAALGVLQVHLSGGEPAARRDLVEIVARRARGRALHQSHHLRRRHHGRGPALRRRRARSCPGLDPGSRAGSADRIAGYDGAFARKQRAAAEAVRLGLPLTSTSSCIAPTSNASARMVELALALGAQPDRDRPRAVLRLGAEEPRRADADARAGRTRATASVEASAQAATRAAS